jgi:hypothetical protein
MRWRGLSPAQIAEAVGRYPREVSLALRKRDQGRHRPPAGRDMFHPDSHRRAADRQKAKSESVIERRFSSTCLE